MTVEQYADPSMNLNYPNEDGDALVRAFKRQKGRLFGQVHVHRIRDAEASPASVEQLLKLIASKARPSDVFMMYASGHGGMVRCEGESKPGCLLTCRASLQSDRTMCSEAIAMDRLTRKMRAVKAKKLCCSTAANRAQRRVETCCLR